MRAIFATISALIAHPLPVLAANIHVDRSSKGGIPIVLVDGTLEKDDDDVFRSTIANLPKAVVAFRSAGGNLVAGILIGETIRQRDFATVVPDGFHCASACALAWLGGARRYMGSKSLVGFHAAYVDRNGTKRETGLGNALVGAYLTKLGLSYSAVIYITQTSPDSMTWLSKHDAERRGIEVTLLPPSSTSKPNLEAPSAQTKPPSVASLSNPRQSELTTTDMESRVRKFVSGYFFFWSLQNSTVLDLLHEYYADQLVYFGNSRTKHQVMLEKQRFAIRWPFRSYSPRISSFQISCEQTAICRASGVVDWDVKSVDRTVVATGSSNFDLKLRLSDSEFKIVYEHSETIERQLQQEAQVQPEPQPQPTTAPSPTEQPRRSERYLLHSPD